MAALHVCPVELRPLLGLTALFTRFSLRQLLPREMYAPNQPVKSGSVVSTNASSGTKRKRQDGPKFYAVRVGAKPGVYYTWNDCLEQVKGFKKAFCGFFFEREGH